MKRTSLLLIVVLAVFVGIHAQHLSEQQAMQRALTFMKKGRQAKAPALQGRHLKSVDCDFSHLYAFNVEGGGYVIASADSRTLPVLGYSDKGSINPDNMPFNMRQWLKGYEAIIAQLPYSDYGNQEEPQSGKPAIEPLLATDWSQDWPYNLQCPVFDGTLNPDWEGQQGITGCVATSMAMLMKYHEWPKEPCATIPAYTFSYSYDYETYDDMTLDALPPTTFDWDNMISEYEYTHSTKEQRNAVAELMRYCGQAVKMMYSPDLSGAYSPSVTMSLVKYFNYDNGARYHSRYHYTIDEWENLIYNELAAGRPIYYAGSGYDSYGYYGHAFNCDGYDGNGMYHINWGWGGNHNGYFSLSVLNPYNEGGKFIWDMNFSFTQNVITGIQPPVEGSKVAPDVPVLDIDYTPMYFSDEGKYQFEVTQMWLNEEYVTVEGAVCTMDEDGTLQPVATAVLENLYYTQSAFFEFYVDDLDLPEGVTKLYAAVRSPECGINDWQMLTHQSKYLEVTCIDGKKTAVLKPELDVEIVDARVQWYITLGGSNFIVMQLKNNGEEYSAEVYIRAVSLGDNGVEDVEQCLEDPANVQDILVGCYAHEGETVDLTGYFSPTKMGKVALYLSTNGVEYDYAHPHYVLTVDNSTGIEQATATPNDATLGNDAWYTLQGVRIAKPSAKGLYIHRNKVVKWGR